MASDPKLHRQSTFWRYGFLWVTLILFAGSFLGHWTLGWFAYVNEQQMHGEAAQFADYAKEALRDTFENWQAEFIGITWQILGLAALYSVGSPQSRESSERLEEKVDLVLRKLDEKGADKEIAKLDREYVRT